MELNFASPVVESRVEDMRLPVCESNRCSRVAPIEKRRFSPGLASTWPPWRTVTSSRASPKRPCSRVSAPSGSAISMSNSSTPSWLGSRCSGRMPSATGVPAGALVGWASSSETWAEPVPARSTVLPPSPTLAARKFMAGEPMKPATNTEAGLS